jgi:hypothetical protein
MHEKLMPEIRKSNNSIDELIFDTLQAVSLTKKHRNKHNVQITTDAI